MSGAPAKAAKISRSRMYEVIRAPVITEKTTFANEQGKVVFRVALDASKGEIKQAVEGLFGVKVTAVNTLRQQGKRKLFRGREGFRSDTKRAIVSLAEGNKIDVTTGL